MYTNYVKKNLSLLQTFFSFAQHILIFYHLAEFTILEQIVSFMSFQKLCRKRKYLPAVCKTYWKNCETKLFMRFVSSNNSNILTQTSTDSIWCFFNFIQKMFSEIYFLTYFIAYLGNKRLLRLETNTILH